MNSIRDLDPASGESIAEVPCATPKEVEEAVSRCRASQRQWRQVDPKERIAQVQKVAQTLLDSAADLADTVTREMGKPRTQALAEANNVGNIFEYYGARVPKFLEPEDIRTGERLSRLYREPLGVIGAITPWNFPIGIPLWTLVPAVMLGNGVVLKPSELVPLTGEMIQRAFARHLPSGLVELCQGADDTGRALVASDVDMISFVGSRSVGKAIMKESASRVRPVALELGGKDPLLILDDADLDKAADMAVWGSISNCGQVCCSIERIYVDKSVAPELESRIKTLLDQVRVGSGFDDSTTVGPMASDEQRQHVLGQIKQAVGRGARLESGGRAIDGAGYFIEPTLLCDADESMAVMTEETFGPVIVLRTVSSDEEALALANDTPYGLGAAVFTENEERAMRIAEQLEAGTIGINRATGSSLACPWGGVKESGLGRLLGTAGLHEFTQEKVLHLS